MLVLVICCGLMIVLIVFRIVRLVIVVVSISRGWCQCVGCSLVREMGGVGGVLMVVFMRCFFGRWGWMDLVGGWVWGLVGICVWDWV